MDVIRKQGLGGFLSALNLHHTTPVPQKGFSSPMGKDFLPWGWGKGFFSASELAIIDLGVCSRCLQCLHISRGALLHILGATYELRGNSSFSLWFSLHARSLQSYPIPCDPMNCSPPGSSVHRIHQARILECIDMPSSRGSS